MKRDRKLLEYIFGYPDPPKLMNTTYTQWTLGLDGFYPSTATKESLDSGLYTVDFDNDHNLIVRSVPVKDEKFYVLKDSTYPKVLDEVYKFWDSKEAYKDKGLPWKRGIILHGKPGNGKSGLVNLLIQRIIEADGIAIYPGDNFSLFTSMANKLLQIEGGRKTLIVLEDLDEIIKAEEREMLEFLDGNSMSTDGALIIATTNYFSDLPDRFSNRPSRFDLCIEIESPNEVVRREYSSKILKDQSKLDSIVEITDGLSMAHIKEAVLLTDIYELSLDEIRIRLCNSKSKMI